MTLISNHPLRLCLIFHYLRIYFSIEWLLKNFVVMIITIISSFAIFIHLIGAVLFILSFSFSFVLLICLLESFGVIVLFLF